MVYVRLFAVISVLNGVLGIIYNYPLSIFLSGFTAGFFVWALFDHVMDKRSAKP